MNEFRPILCKDHPAAVEYGPLCNRIACIELALCFHIDNQLDHLIGCGSQCYKTNVVGDPSFTQNGILIADPANPGGR